MMLVLNDSFCSVRCCELSLVCGFCLLSVLCIVVCMIVRLCCVLFVRWFLMCGSMSVVRL